MILRGRFGTVCSVRIRGVYGLDRNVRPVPGNGHEADIFTVSDIHIRTRRVAIHEDLIDWRAGELLWNQDAEIGVRRMALKVEAQN